MKEANSYIESSIFKDWDKQLIKICPTCGEKIYHNTNPVTGESFDTECKCMEEARTNKEVLELMNNKEALIALHKKECGFSPRDVDDVSKSIRTHSGNIKAYNTVLEYSKNFDKNVTMGLYLYGEPGVGKSLLSKKAMAIILNKGYSAYITSVSKLMKNIKDELATFSDKTFRKCLDVDLLVIDDIGVEKPTDFDKAQMFELINGRYENKKPIIYTSNCKLDDLIAKYDEFGRIYSRISGSVVKLEIKGVDFRQHDNESSKS